MGISIYNPTATGVDVTSIGNTDAATEAADIKAIEDAMGIEKKEAAEAETAVGRTTTAEAATIEGTTGKSSTELKAELDKLESEKSANYKKMERIEAKIDELKKEIKEDLANAKELQEKGIEDYQEEADKAVEQQMNAYIEANKEGGDGMSKQELKNNIAKSLPSAPHLAAAIAEYVTASKEIEEVDNLLGQFNTIILDTNALEIDIKETSSAYDSACKAEEAQRAAEAQASQSKKSCDPIGFVKDGARYDFIVDDGSFDSTSDFLGADNQWASMEALDSDGDRVINASELKEAGIKMVKTVNGEQQVVDIADEFGESFSIDLDSYKSGGSYDGISNADSDGDGVADQELLGTYTINIDGEAVKGYNTLDDVDYLQEEYGVKNDVGNVDADKMDTTGFSAELQEHANFFNESIEEVAGLKNEYDEGINSLGLSENTMASIKEFAKSEGEKDANIFMKQMEEEVKKEQEAEDAKKAEAEAKAKAEEEAKAKEEAEAEEQTKAEEEAKTAQKEADEATKKANAEGADDATKKAAEQLTQKAAEAAKEAGLDITGQAEIKPFENEDDDNNNNVVQTVDIDDSKRVLKRKV